ncbi:trypsin-like peptidase domain-containing protein [Staphylococcus haemolyticus]|uniref:trypsin-like peptidase domain-containing protein n=1 Tax=Staphylococcus haemolyticus TaxID=1283 RepID=UPI00374E6D78
MDNDKKHVIPREQYRRKRHEYFHNEEREERLEREREQRERLAKKEQEQAKVNEERVKDNMRKARIEKLTQEEIHQQQHLAKLRSDNESDQELNDTNTHHLTLPEEQQLKNEHKENNDKVTKPTDEMEKQEKEDNNSASSKHDEIEPKYSRVEKNKGKQKQDNINKSEVNHLDKSEQTKKHKETKESSEDVLETNKSQKIEQKEQKASSNETSNKELNSYTKDKNNKVEDNQDLKKASSQNLAHSNKLEENEHLENEPKNNDTMDKVKDFLKLHWLKIVIVVAIILIVILISAIISTMNQNSSIEQSSNNDTKYTTTMKNAETAVKSVVTIENDTPKNITTQTIDKTNINSNNEVGSGVVYKAVDDTFFILTNTHIVGSNKRVNITYDDDKTATATVVGRDMWSDIAVLKATIKNKNMQPIKIGHSKHLKLGESILVVGNPLGNDFKNTVTKGIISGLNRAVPVDFDKDNKNDEWVNTFQIDASVNPGNSGGAVVNRVGELVGLVSLKINMPNIEGMGFAIPIDAAREIAEELEKKGEIQYPNTGIGIKKVSDLMPYERNLLKVPEDVQNGIVVEKLKENGLGKKSGLKIGDVVVELDSKSIQNNLQYRQIIFNHRQDLKTLSAKIYREGKSQEIRIKLK